MVWCGIGVNLLLCFFPRLLNRSLLTKMRKKFSKLIGVNHKIFSNLNDVLLFTVSIKEFPAHYRFKLCVVLDYEGKDNLIEFD